MQNRCRSDGASRRYVAYTPPMPTPADFRGEGGDFPLLGNRPPRPRYARGFGAVYGLSRGTSTALKRAVRFPAPSPSFPQGDDWGGTEAQ